MIEAARERLGGRDRIVLETLTGIRRAGADIVPHLLGRRSSYLAHLTHKPQRHHP